MSLINKLKEVGRKASRGLAVAGLGAYLCLSGLGANGGGCSNYQGAALSSALLRGAVPPKTARQLQAQQSLAGIEAMMMQADANNAQSESGDHINLNVFTNENGDIRPRQGYTWANPKDQNDLRVKPAQGYEWANAGDPSDLRVREKISNGYPAGGVFLTCSGWEDVDGNGLMPDEFWKKTRFSKTEHVYFVSALLEKIGENMEFKLLREKDGSVDVVDTKQFVVIKAYQLLKYDTNSLAPGSYTGIWKIDGKTINNRSITIE